MGSYTIVSLARANIYANQFYSSSTFLQLVTENQAKEKDLNEKLGKIITFPLVSLELYKQIFTEPLYEEYIYTLFSLLHSIYRSTLHPTSNLVLLAVKNINFYTASVQLSGRHGLFSCFFLTSICLFIDCKYAQTPS